MLRRIIRRAIRYGRRLGLDEPFLAEVAEEVLPLFRDVYRELLENHDFILRVIRLEEDRFGEAYERGIGIFSGMVKYREIVKGRDLNEILPETGGVHPPGQLAINSTNEDENTGAGLADEAMQAAMARAPGQDLRLWFQQERQAWAKLITGQETFSLYDTYGFPPELTAEIAREHGMKVDLDGFEREMEAQRERARSAHAFTGAMEVVTAYETLGVDRTQFVGYEGLRQDTVLAAIMVSPSTSSALTEPVAPGSAEPAGHATKGQEVELVLEASPFYPEGGGQVGDRGTIAGPNGVVRIKDTQSPVAGLIVHRGVVEQGDISLGDAVTAQVDITRRMDAARSHSGTHLLHASLRSVLGPHVRQAGSMVAPERLRFDFSHVSPLSADEIGSVQSLANERIRDNLTVHSHETTYSEAVREGALAFFGDRYGDVVRVVAMSSGDPFDSAQDGPFSLEVCGGTHVTATGQVGTMLVLGESSIGGGMRRIEAVTGRAAEAMMVDYAAKLESLAGKLQTPVADLETRLDSFIQDTEELKRRLATLERTTLRSEAERMLERVVEVEGVRVVVGRTSATSAEGMREMGDFLKAKLASVVVVLGAVVNGSPMLVAMVTPDLVSKGLHAGNMVREAAGVMGGSGGGRPDMAQAGGPQAEKLDDALGGVPELVRRSLS